MQCEITSALAGDGIDNDCDGKIDEEVKDGKDNDGDGKIDEDIELVIYASISCLKYWVVKKKLPSFLYIFRSNRLILWLPVEFAANFR